MAALEVEVQNVKREVSDVKACLTEMDGKLDNALQNKADWETVTALTTKLDAKADAAELKQLHDRLPLWVTWAFTATGGLIGALVTAIYFLLEHR
jgi:hypothetical protein